MLAAKGVRSSIGSYSGSKPSQLAARPSRPTSGARPLRSNPTPAELFGKAWVGKNWMETNKYLKPYVSAWGSQRTSAWRAPADVPSVPKAWASTAAATKKKPAEKAPASPLPTSEHTALVAAVVRDILPALRTFGHRWADLNPLTTTYPEGADANSSKPWVSKTTAPLAHGVADVNDAMACALAALPTPTRHFLQESLNTLGDLNNVKLVPGQAASLGLGAWAEGQSVGLVFSRLVRTYSGPVGLEFGHIEEPEEFEWLAEQMELGYIATPEEQKALLDLVGGSEAFDEFLHRKFPTLKRYGLQGSESALAALQVIFSSSASSGVKDIVIGMAHRGRLNLLVRLLRFSAPALFYKLSGKSMLPNPDFGGLDDVLSHLAQSVELSFAPGAVLAVPTGAADPAAKSVHVSLIHNPSHLEAVNPVAIGKAYARHRRLAAADPSRPLRQTLALLVHGDAAMAGQGVNFEMTTFLHNPYLSTEGVVHVVTNNQLGYTANPRDSRSGRYCTDLALQTRAPVFHINGDHPESVLFATRLAIAYRQKFGKDVYVDVVGYRKYGHNELDEPAFTQPGLYQNIRSRPSTAAIYAHELKLAGLVPADALATLKKSVEAELEAAFLAGKTFQPTPELIGLQAQWSSLVHPPVALAQGTIVTSPVTAAESVETLREIGRASVKTAGLKIHERLQRSFVDARLAKLDADPRSPEIDWATAEALAIGSLLLEGYNVRFSGQDAPRGTFSQRHFRLFDQSLGPTHDQTFDPAPDHSPHGFAATQSTTTPLAQIRPGQGRLEIFNSPLTELAAMGFEYGLSVEDPNTLPIWEAQFGDFANGAQIMLDQFVSSGEEKWWRQSGLVVMVPHGYDGTGPEHSSARIERFLQLVNTDAINQYVSSGSASRDSKVPNLGVIFPTTSANYFHALRRQMKRNYRKPLVVIGPKTLIRLPAAQSPLHDLADPSVQFRPVLADPDFADSSVEVRDQVKHVLICSGKWYYDLAAEKKKRGRSDMAIVRLEELSPFPAAEMKAELQRFSQATKYVWAQEEPQNMGAWSYADPRLRHLVGIPARMLYFVGQPPLGASSVGSSDLHKAVVNQLIADTFDKFPMA